MKNALMNYWNDEQAAEAVQVILIVIIGVGITIALGGFLWLFFQRQSKTLVEVESHMDTVSDDPFGEGTNPFR